MKMLAKIINDTSMHKFTIGEIVTLRAIHDSLTTSHKLVFIACSTSLKIKERLVPNKDIEIIGLKETNNTIFYLEEPIELTDSFINDYLNQTKEEMI